MLLITHYHSTLRYTIVFFFSVQDTRAMQTTAQMPEIMLAGLWFLQNTCAKKITV
jgi:hypothetical protein